MSGRLAVCPSCRRYSLRAACPVCAHATTTPHPARFSPEDAYGHYRRELKRRDRTKATAKAGAPAKGA